MTERGIVVVGGSDAGISAALRIKELDPRLGVRVVVADAFPNFSICGLPFYHSGEVQDWQTLAHRTLEEIKASGIELMLNTAAARIVPDAHVLEVTGPDSASELLYDKLVVATGAQPSAPPIPGLELTGVHLLHFMESSFALENSIVRGGARRAVIIGTGYIGLEMADALVTRGLEVTVIGLEPTPLHTIDPLLGLAVQNVLERHGVRVLTETPVDHIERRDGALAVMTKTGKTLDADVVLVATGVEPNAELLAAAGARTGIRGAASVSRAMETSIPEVYAAGDCCETWHRILHQPMYLPLGTTAHKQGRVAGENAAGWRREFAGTLGTQVLKIFELAVARTGLNDVEAARAGFDPLTIESSHDDHKAYYPGAARLRFRVTGDRNSGRLLGAQLIGHWQAAVAKRIDVFATALFHEMSVEALSDLDLSYTPPLGSPWDAVQMAAQAWTGARERAHVNR